MLSNVCDRNSPSPELLPTLGSLHSGAVLRPCPLLGSCLFKSRMVLHLSLLLMPRFLCFSTLSQCVGSDSRVCLDGSATRPTCQSSLADVLSGYASLQKGLGEAVPHVTRGAGDVICGDIQLPALLGAFVTDPLSTVRPRAH